MIGYVCKYTPVEVFAGFGESHSFLLPDEAAFDYAESRMWPAVCGYAKSVLQCLSGGGYDSAVFTDCCDAMKRVYDVLSADAASSGQDAEGCPAFPFMIGLPRVISEASTRAYAHSIGSFIARYGEHSGKAFSVDAFVGACASAGGADATGADSRDESAGGYVAILGARAPAALTKAAGELCALPVRDLTCGSGERGFLREAALTQNVSPGVPSGRSPQEQDLDELLYRYAAALLSQPPCARMHGGSERALSDDAPLKAIVYHTIQFCDFYGFEYARMPRRRPALKIETDYANASSGQMVTRLQAFFESNGILLGKGCMDRSGAPPHGSAQAETSRRFEGKDEGAKANMADTYCAGTDSGSTTTNVVIMGGDGRIVAAVTVPTGADSARAARAAMDEALRGAGLAADDIACSVATGYGRASVPSATKDVTEITCHAKGAHRLAPEARTVIDIGGQDSKVIRLDGDGGVAEFSMNDKCAAGTGRFLELMADTLGMSMDEMARSGLNPRETVNVSSMCAVFAESEVISLIAQGKDASDIAWGIDLAIAGRVAAMATRIGATPPYVMTGGVANNEGVVKALSGKFRESGDDVGRRTEFFVPENPQMCGALGAAVIARDMVQTARRNI